MGFFDNVRNWLGSLFGVRKKEESLERKVEKQKKKEEKKGVKEPLEIPEKVGEVDEVPDVIKRTREADRKEVIEKVQEKGLEQLKQVEKQMAKAPSMKEYSKGLSNDAVAVMLDYVPNLNNTKQVYKRVLTAKMLKGKIDSDVIDILYENREKLMHKFSADIQVITQNGLVGTIYVVGVLAESFEILQHWIGQTVDYPVSKIAQDVEKLRLEGKVRSWSRSGDGGNNEKIMSIQTFYRMV